jgi:hypothetical protein
MGRGYLRNLTDLTSFIGREAATAALTEGQLVEANGWIYRNYAGGQTDEVTLVTAAITASRANTFFIISASACVGYAAVPDADQIDPTFRLKFDGTTLETETTTLWDTSVDNTTGKLSFVQLAATVDNPAESEKIVLLTKQPTDGTAASSNGYLSIREVYNA